MIDFDTKFAIMGRIRVLRFQALTNNWILEKSAFSKLEKNLRGIDGIVVRQLMKASIYKSVSK